MLPLSSFKGFLRYVVSDINPVRECGQRHIARFECKNAGAGAVWVKDNGACRLALNLTRYPCNRGHTGNIGYHHIHHLRSRIPSYRLHECLKDFPELRDVNRLTLVDSLKCASLALWDDAERKLRSFREIR